MFVVKQQQVVMTLDNHRWTTVVLPPTLHTKKTYEEAISLVYKSFAESEASSHYATISYGGRFIRAVKLGSLDGFKRPGIIQ